MQSKNTPPGGLNARGRVAFVILVLGCASLGFAQDGQPDSMRTPADPGPVGESPNDSELDSLRRELEALNERLRAVEAAPAAPAATAPLDSSSVRFRLGTKEEGRGFVLEFADEMRLRFGGQIRWRAEYRGDRYAQPKANSSTDFVLQRTRLTFAYDLSAHLGAKVTIQDSRRWGDKLDGLAGARLDSDQPELMLYEGYASLRNPFELPLEVRVGRMEVPNLGDQRLISSLDWSNVGRSFDGVQAIFTPKGWFMTAFAANLREGGALPTPGDENDDLWMLGAYVSNRMVENHELDAFFYWRRIGDNKLGALTTDHTGDRGARKDYTLGVRLKGGAGPLFYNGLVAYQFGQVAGDTIHAWATAVEVGAKFKLGEEQVFRISTEGAWSSGDPDSSDGRIETFDPLLPFAHFYNGHQDLFAWRNLYSTNLKLAFSPLEGLSFHSDLHWFWLQRRDDSWYGLGFSRADTANVADSSNVGAEVDVYAKWKLFEGRLDLWAGYSHFFPGEYIRDTGSKSSDQSWAFFMATVNF